MKAEETNLTEGNGENEGILPGRGDCLLTRVELAQALKVSLSTVDRLLADEEITPVRLREKLVRFYLPDVLGELREKAGTSKRSCTRRI